MEWKGEEKVVQTERGNWRRVEMKKQKEEKTKVPKTQFSLCVFKISSLKESLCHYSTSRLQESSASTGRSSSPL